MYSIMRCVHKLSTYNNAAFMTCRLKGQGGVDKNEVRVIAGPVMDRLALR